MLTDVGAIVVAPHLRTDLQRLFEHLEPFPHGRIRNAKGDMLALDLESHTLLSSQDIDQRLKTRHPYKAWLKKGVRYLESDLVDPRLAAEPMDSATLSLYQKMFNVTQEEREDIIRVLAQDENEAVGSMGDDTPLPVLSNRVRSLYDYFRQQFAQVTNPPIDPLRESLLCEARAGACDSQLTPKQRPLPPQRGALPAQLREPVVRGGELPVERVERQHRGA